MIQDLVRVDAEKVAGQPRIDEVQLGGLDETFAEILKKRGH